MPTPPKRLDNTSKHWTNRERKARRDAESGMQNSSRVVLRAPAWLSDDALKIWTSLKRKLRKVDLLDSLDTDLLAIYCDAQAHYQSISKKLHDGAAGVQDIDEMVKEAQAWARLISAYAEKLGLSPNARARLAKKKAEEAPLDDMEQILSEATYYANGGQ